MNPKLKDRVKRLANNMFSVSFLGYGTKDLAKKADISDNDAILLQSGSTLVPLTSMKKMEDTVNEIEKEYEKKNALLK